MDILAQLFDLVDENSTITHSHVDGNFKYITVEKNLMSLYCPYCNSRLRSKGFYIRKPSHQILQDGSTLILTVKPRKWKCPSCNYYEVDTFSFLQPHKKVSIIIQLQILNTLKDINLTTRQVADKFNVSDTYVHQLFLRYVNLPRLPLTENIAIDEVYLNISPSCKYALVIMDFDSGDIIDILISRREKITQPYFSHIPLEERNRVKHIICDMYSPFVNYTSRYFHNSIAITDSFHCLQWLLSLINRYINDVKKKYQKRDRDNLKIKNDVLGKDFKNSKDSPEVYILKNATWVLLKNKANWKYYDSHYVKPLKRYMDTYDWEEAFLNLDPHFRHIRTLKDLYEDFNASFINDIDGAANRLNELINIYKNSTYQIFKDFATLLIKYYDSIINSFTYVKDHKNNHESLRQLSNGPLESFNNIPSHYRTNSRGVNNFDYTRNRILWATRKNAPILGTPRNDDEIKTTGKKRGPYKKKNTQI